jgi:2-polyprenyl-3-methyl-5-hydroxy-6-metoxy-1,4-benzoquinol methylase
VNFKRIVKSILPLQARQWLRRQPLRLAQHLRWDGFIFDRTTPTDVHWGGKRGTVIDRYYIEHFLAEHALDVHGRVLEFGSDVYARKYGSDRVQRIDVLDLGVENPHATIVADLNHGDELPAGAFDCIICTQVLLLVYDLRAAIASLHRMLKPGGVLLLTSPGIQKISRGDMEIGGDFWRFTPLAINKLLEEAFPSDRIKIETFGNALTASGFLHGLAVEDIQPMDMDTRDSRFPVSICARAVKPL